MIRGTTRTGFAFEVQDAALDDYELVETLNRLEAGEPQVITTVVDKLLGNEQKERLKDHVRVDGRVSIGRIMDEIADIFNQKGEIKN